jgi:hypothetical protein
MLDRHDLSDAEWAMLEPVLPGRTPRRAGRRADHRLVVSGVFLADADGLAVAGSGRAARALEDRLQPAPALVRGRDVGEGPGRAAPRLR